MHPCSLILSKLQVEFNSLPRAWKFVYCCLELIERYDPRPIRESNPVRDFLKRVVEAGVPVDTPAYLRMRQLLEPTLDHYDRFPAKV